IRRLVRTSRRLRGRMVELPARAAVTVFFSPDPFATGLSLTLGEDVAQHARATRLALGTTVELRDGLGGTGAGTLSRISKSTVVIDVTAAGHVAKPPEIHLLAPVADRER